MTLDIRQKYLEFFRTKEHLIYPSASLKSSDPGLLFNVAGMQQFKPYFQGATPHFPGYGTFPRVTTAQKCMRAGGKDSDIENVGRTRRHHTFFEMMGNFSFGDYFKREAITWAWEFLTSSEWLGLDPERLHVTVFLDDDEAYDIWATEVGIPAERLSRWGEAENFWPANAIQDGRQGPCGPCSEIFYDRGPGFGSSDETGPNTGSGDRYMEIWNLVFTQFDLQDGVLTPLPQKNIDTGMGLERITTVVSGAQDAYSTELFQPVIRRLVELSGVEYDDIRSVEQRIIADHVRAVTFAITDGIAPANDGAGYVVKMLIRRASRQAWLLGLREPVLHELAGLVVDTMAGAYPDLNRARSHVQLAIRTEEEQFLRTLESGIARVGHLLDGLQGDTLPGDVAFDLWQTYGFPLDLTSEMAAERGFSVDAAGYAAAREQARQASRGSMPGSAMFGSGDAVEVAAGETEFTGYTETSAAATVQALLDGETQVAELTEGQHGQAVLDVTPFYAEGGGQVGDSGKLDWEGGSALVSGTRKTASGLYLHSVRVVRGRLKVGSQVTAVVDPQRRDTEKHHSATHLLHAALRSVLGEHVTQAGSLVTPDRLRFDFSNPGALSREQLEQVEGLVNSWIQADLPVNWRQASIEEAREQGAMMLFGEKYGDTVRMVSMGDVSLELCGGTHVESTGQIGSLVIVEDSAVSAGVRRIEARVGTSALHWVQEKRAQLQELAAQLGAPQDAVTDRARKLQEDLREARREAKTLRDRLAAAQTSGAAAASAGSSGEVEGIRWAARTLQDLDAAALRNAADTLLQQPDLAVAVVSSGPLLVVKVADSAREKGAHAGNLVRELASRAGGKGGGRPDMAQAGVQEARLSTALESLPELLREQLAN